MEIEVTKSKTVKVKIELPYYCKTSVAYYKVIDNETCLQAADRTFNPEIQIAHAGLAFALDYTECTREEFESAFKEVSMKLTEIALK